jgi:hypothetical protein
LIQKPKKKDIENKQSKNPLENIDNEKNDFEKIKNINLNIDLSFNNLDIPGESFVGNNDSSMDSSMCSYKLEEKKLKSINNTNVDLEAKAIDKRNSIFKDTNFIFLDIDENNNKVYIENKDTIVKSNENEFLNRTKTKNNSISNLNMNSKLNSNNNLIVTEAKKNKNVSVIGSKLKLFF